MHALVSHNKTVVIEQEIKALLNQASHMSQEKCKVINVSTKLKKQKIF